MDAVPSESRLAVGTINPMTFVMSGAVAGAGTGGGSPQPGVLTALQCTGGSVPIIGVAQEWTNAMMGTAAQTAFAPQGYPAAVAGQAIRVYERLERCMVMIGSGYTVEPDTFCVSDASGNAIPYNPTATGAVQAIGGRTIEGGVAGTVVRFVVDPQQYLGHA